METGGVPADKSCFADEQIAFALSQAETRASLATLLVAAVAVPWILVQLPEDYFAESRRPVHGGDTSVRRILLMALKNVAGGLLVLAGLAMLVLPGQGLLTIALGLATASFPGKYRLERWLLVRGPILRMVNALRRKYRRKPFVLPRGSG